MILVAAGIVIGAMNATALAGNVDDQLLTAQNIALMLLAYPLVKTFHELGHAYATKAWGGAVHEIGVMLLIFIPCPMSTRRLPPRFAANGNGRWSVRPASWSRPASRRLR